MSVGAVIILSQLRLFLSPGRSRCWWVRGDAGDAGDECSVPAVLPGRAGTRLSPWHGQRRLLRSESGSLNTAGSAQAQRGFHLLLCPALGGGRGSSCAAGIASTGAASSRGAAASSLGVRKAGGALES